MRAAESALGHEPAANRLFEGVRVVVRDLGARLLHPKGDDGAGERLEAAHAAASGFEPRGYSVTVDAHPYERSGGQWVIGDVTVRVCFYCSTSTHLLVWPDDCKFDSAADASRAAYEEARHWAFVRYG